MQTRILKNASQITTAPLDDRSIAIIGYGNQGAAHALNIRDSGCHVIVGNRLDTAGADRARKDGFEPVPIPEAISCSDLFIVALPDEVHGDAWAELIAPHLKPGHTAGFLHGYSIHFGHVSPPGNIGAILVAPKGPGHTLRQRYVEGTGIPCLFAVHQQGDHGQAEELGLAWAAAIGCARAAIIRTTFKDETETDLFGEQAVLCGGITALMLTAWELLVEAGYPEDLAYMECCQEVKQVADLAYAHGPSAMMDAISNTAEFGSYVAGPLLIDETVRQRMRELMDDILSGAFARKMADDRSAGFPFYSASRKALAEHPIEKAGSTVRSWMPWLADDAGTPGDP